MAEKDCTFAKTGVCNCKIKQDRMATECSKQTNEDIKGITNYQKKFLPRKRTS